MASSFSQERGTGGHAGWRRPSERCSGGAGDPRSSSRPGSAVLPARPPGSPPVLNLNPLVSEPGRQRRACPVCCEAQLLRERLSWSPGAESAGRARRSQAQTGAEQWRSHCGHGRGRNIGWARNASSSLSSLSALKQLQCFVLNRSSKILIFFSDFFFFPEHSVGSDPGTQPLYGKPCLASTFTGLLEYATYRDIYI